jgi:hypothetical protein
MALVAWLCCPSCRTWRLLQLATCNIIRGGMLGDRANEGIHDLGSIVASLKRKLRSRVVVRVRGGR